MAELMKGKRGLIMGVANQRSIAWGIASAMAAEGADPHAAKRGHMAGGAQHPGEIARQRPHIGPLAAFDLEPGVVGIGHVDERQPGDPDRPGGDKHEFQALSDALECLLRATPAPPAR